MILILCEKIYCKFTHKFNRDTSKVYILIGKFNSILVQNFIPKIKNPFFSLYIQYIKNHSKLTNSSIVTNFISRRNSKLSRAHPTYNQRTKLLSSFLRTYPRLQMRTCIYFSPTTRGTRFEKRGNTCIFGIRKNYYVVGGIRLEGRR